MQIIDDSPNRDFNAENQKARMKMIEDNKREILEAVNAFGGHLADVSVLLIDADTIRIMASEILPEILPHKVYIIVGSKDGFKEYMERSFPLPDPVTYDSLLEPPPPNFVYVTVVALKGVTVTLLGPFESIQINTTIPSSPNN